MNGLFKKRAVSKLLPIILISTVILTPAPARADFWGGDIPLLIQIVANTLQELAQLRAILGNGTDTLDLLRQVNQGISDAMSIMRTMNTTLQPGIFSQYKDPSQLFNALQSLYGVIPQTSQTQFELAQDQSVSEAIILHNQAFDYADQVDPEAERIKDYSHNVSPAGAGKLTAESLGVLIHVSNQILRTNAAMLKILSENLALQNRKEKVNSLQFQEEYDGLNKGLDHYPSLQTSSQLTQ